jgi:hypothetical protein
MLKEESKINMAKSFAYKGIEYVDFILNTQTDPLVDNDRLGVNFLDLSDKLGLIL